MNKHYSGVAGLRPGGNHTCARVGGAIKCWGLNDKGQLGDGTTTQRLTPVAVTGITSNGSSMTMGYAHSCAKVIGGGLKCWGSNSDGQLSDNTVTYSTTPLVIGFTGYTYAYDSTHKHAATSLSTGETYTYDANGNMITRVENGVTYTQGYDAENRLISVNVTGQSLPTLFIYDGDGNLVKQIKPDNSKTLYVGGIYEVNKNAGGSVTSTKTYYPAAGAMRDGSTLYYVLKDHLGSASVLTNASGGIVTGADTRYYPFGEARFSTTSMVTDKLFTGQRQIAELGIYHYDARFRKAPPKRSGVGYSPKLGRFLSADTIVPGYANPQNLNRFSYVLNNPLKYTDPTGHMMDDGNDGGGGKCDRACIRRLKQERREKQKEKAEETGPITDTILGLPGSEDFYNGLAIGFDATAWVVDAFAAGSVIYGGIAGAGLGLPGMPVAGPAAPAVTGLAGMVVAEFYVQPILTVGNVFATLSTTSTVIADTKAGNTRIEEGVFSSAVSNSATLTGVGWLNKEAFLSLAIQTVALTNDFGWTSLPFK